MSSIQVIDEPTAVRSDSPPPPLAMPKFARDQEFQHELRRRVDDYFDATGQRRRDCLQMYLKSFVILGAFAATYVLLVFAAQTWWQILPLTILLGLACAQIGFNIQHDAGHRAYSDSSWVNKLMSLTLDLIGGSSYFWHWKHAVCHHTYVNITHHDSDIDLGILGRLSPHQRRLGFHRWQHWYLWPLYGMLAMKWHFYDDFVDFARGRIGSQRVPRPRGSDLAIFVLGKLTFFAWALALPMLFHPVWGVLVCYAISSFTLGIALSVVFQLAHSVGEADFPMLESGRIDSPWAVHQVETTVDFSRRSTLVSWLLGGLNFQIEHHLFPRVCHVHYPALSKIVEETCREFGVRYVEHPTFRAGLASHYRWLRRMGAADDAA